VSKKLFFDKTLMPGSSADKCTPTKTIYHLVFMILTQDLMTGDIRGGKRGILSRHYQEDESLLKLY